jgi:hypothetical protein
MFRPELSLAESVRVIVFTACLPNLWAGQVDRRRPARSLPSHRDILKEGEEQCCPPESHLLMIRKQLRCLSIAAALVPTPSCAQDGPSTADCMMRWNAQGNAESQAAVVAAGFSRATVFGWSGGEGGDTASRPSSLVGASRGQPTCSGLMHRVQAHGSKGTLPVRATALASWAPRHLSRRMPWSR